MKVLEQKIVPESGMIIQLPNGNKVFIQTKYHKKVEMDIEHNKVLREYFGRDKIEIEVHSEKEA